MKTPQHVDHSENEYIEDPNVGYVDTWITNKRFHYNYSYCYSGDQALSKEDLPLQ
jgi:hypothetical protein